MEKASIDVDVCARTSCYYSVQFCFCFPFILVQIWYRRVYAESTNDISDGLEGQQCWYKRRLCRASRSNSHGMRLFSKCVRALSSPRTSQIADSARGISQIEPNCWISLCALVDYIFYRRNGKNIQQHLGFAMVTARLSFRGKRKAGYSVRRVRSWKIGRGKRGDSVMTHECETEPPRCAKL